MHKTNTMYVHLLQISYLVKQNVIVYELHFIHHYNINIKKNYLNVYQIMDELNLFNNINCGEPQFYYPWLATRKKL